MVVSAPAVRSPFTVTEPPVLPMRFRVPVPRLTMPSTSAPEPWRTRLKFAAARSKSVIAPVPELKVVLPARVMAPAVPKFSAALVELMVPSKLLAPATVFCAPPVKAKPLASMVRDPVLRKVTALVTVPPPLSTTL